MVVSDNIRRANLSYANLNEANIQGVTPLGATTVGVLSDDATVFAVGDQNGARSRDLGPVLIDVARGGLGTLR